VVVVACVRRAPTRLFGVAVVLVVWCLGPKSLCFKDGLVVRVVVVVVTVVPAGARRVRRVPKAMMLVVVDGYWKIVFNETGCELCSFALDVLMWREKSCIPSSTIGLYHLP
jgi:hypothetical protein